MRPCFYVLCWKVINIHFKFKMRNVLQNEMHPGLGFLGKNFHFSIKIKKKITFSIIIAKNQLDN